jgi:alkylhydroperoxidase/carboxymuconolactone decarboxylase family protein YurZ
MSKGVPKQLTAVRDEFPAIWDAFTTLAEACHEQGGPLDERSRKLVKLAIAVGHRHEGAVHSAVRQARAAGLSREELLHVAMLAITTVGWPSARAALSWIEDVAADESVNTVSEE